MTRATALVSMLVLSLSLSPFFCDALFSAEVTYATLVPKTAKSMAMGGVFSALPTAEFSFFGNPASFASNKKSFALPSLDVWSYGRPTIDSIGDYGAILAAAGGSGDFLSKAFNLMSENGASGCGASAGLGFAGKGLGLGLSLTTDNYIEGSLPSDELVRSDTEISAVLGMGAPIRLGSALLSIGGDLRPFYRLRLRDEGGGAPALADLLVEGSGMLYGEAFFGAAMDLGASLGFGSFTVGLSVRDIAPSYPIAKDKLAKIWSGLGSGKMPDTRNSVDRARFWPLISAGLSWAPKLAPGKVEPALYFELSDPIGVAKDWEGPISALNLIHLGAEVELFNFLAIRGGINRGGLSAGAGIKLLFLDLNAAFFTEELGAWPGDKPRSGLSFQAAFRF
jgi:hypothetical protein